MIKWAMLVVGIFIATEAVTHADLKSYAEDKYKDLQVFAKVLNLVQRYYVVDVDGAKLLQGGIKGMLNELDPHTNYLPPDIFKEFQDETSGEFGGIGIEISVQDEVLTIISPIEDTPAWKAGIKAGDKIVNINGESTKGLSLVEAAQRMKGKDGEVIHMGIMRKDFEKPKTFDIKRGRVRLKSVKATDMLDGYLYVRITSFIENTHDDFAKIMKKHIKKYGKIKGLIIDLRNNPGGLLDQAVKMADEFLEEGIIVSTKGRNEKDKEIISAKKDNNQNEYPIILVMNEYSASASEILAGALQDNNRALVLGQRSFGKGSVQSVVKLGDGSGLKLTVARYYTPKGTEIQSEGIKPDIIVDDIDPEAYQKLVVKKTVRREADMSRHLKGKRERGDVPVAQVGTVNSRDGLLRKDFQITQAFNYLKASRVFRKAEAKPDTVELKKVVK
jgi:carboxyl-terminal processing protease